MQGWAIVPCAVHGDEAPPFSLTGGQYMKEIWKYRKLIFGIHFGGPKTKWKSPYLRPLMILVFRLNLLTGGGRTEDWFVTVRYWTMGTLEEFNALNS